MIEARPEILNQVGKREPAGGGRSRLLSRPGKWREGNSANSSFQEFSISQPCPALFLDHFEPIQGHDSAAAIPAD